MVAEVRALLSGKRARAEQIGHRLDGLEDASTTASSCSRA